MSKTLTWEALMFRVPGSQFPVLSSLITAQKIIQLQQEITSDANKGKRCKICSALSKAKFLHWMFSDFCHILLSSLPNAAVPEELTSCESFAGGPNA